MFVVCEINNLFCSGLSWKSESLPHTFSYVLSFRLNSKRHDFLDMCILEATYQVNAYRYRAWWGRIQILWSSILGRNQSQQYNGCLIKWYDVKNSLNVLGMSTKSWLWRIDHQPPTTQPFTSSVAFASFESRTAFGWSGEFLFSRMQIFFVLFGSSIH